MAFWRCFYHIVWATHQRLPLITPAAEKVILQCVRKKSIELESPLIAANCVSDHIHVAVSIPPKLAVAQWVRGMKGFSSKEVNDVCPPVDSHFRWQEGYGVLTFGEKNLNLVLSYIAKQKEHHLNNTLQPYLEQIED